MNPSGWSRRRVLAVGGQVLVGGAAAGWSAVCPASASTPAGIGWWVLEPGAEAVRSGRASRVLVIGQRDLYAWWRDLRREAVSGRAMPAVQGLTRWAACGVMQMCAREAGLQLVVEPATDARRQASMVAWHLR